MTQKYAIKKAAKLLRDYRLYQAALSYRADSDEHDEMYRAETERQNRTISRRVRAIEDGMNLMTPLERKVVTHLIIEQMPVEDVCEVCALERSSVYRYRLSALRKLAVIFYDAE